MSRRKDGQKEKEEQDDDDDNDGESCWLNNFDTKLDESIKNLKMMMKMMKKEEDEVKSFPFKVKVDFLFAISIRMWPENSN